MIFQGQFSERDGRKSWAGTPGPHDHLQIISVSPESDCADRRGHSAEEQQHAPVNWLLHVSQSRRALADGTSRDDEEEEESDGHGVPSSEIGSSSEDQQQRGQLAAARTDMARYSFSQIDMGVELVSSSRMSSRP